MTLPSEIKELKNKIRELQENQFMTGTIILQNVTGIINRSNFLTEEQKERLLELVWKGRS